LYGRGAVKKASAVTQLAKTAWASIRGNT
jgi:hypothetical protein